MPVKGINRLNANLDRFVSETIPHKAESAIYIAATVGAGYASLMTPIDTSYLVNSQYIDTYANYEGAYAHIGYSARYAAAVHNKKGTLSGKPRSNGNGNYWSPNGEPQFLKRGFEDNKQEITNIFYREMKV